MYPRSSTEPARPSRPLAPREPAWARRWPSRRSSSVGSVDAAGRRRATPPSIEVEGPSGTGRISIDWTLGGRTVDGGLRGRGPPRPRPRLRPRDGDHQSNPVHPHPLPLQSTPRRNSSRSSSRRSTRWAAVSHPGRPTSTSPTTCPHHPRPPSPWRRSAPVADSGSLEPGPPAPPAPRLPWPCTCSIFTTLDDRSPPRRQPRYTPRGTQARERAVPPLSGARNARPRRRAACTLRPTDVFRSHPHAGHRRELPRVSL